MLLVLLAMLVDKNRTRATRAEDEEGAARR